MILHNIMLSELKEGTEFYVHNGGWNGKIIRKHGEKYVLINGDEIKLKNYTYPMNRTLTVTIKGE